MNNILCFDCETTGLNPKNDRIIQLAAVKFSKDGYKILNKYSWYIKPDGEYNISADAQATHGLSKEFIEQNGIPFKDVADTFLNLMEDSDILTFNGNSFDIKFLYEELNRINMDFPMDGRMFYDAFSMECRFTPRTLGDVYKRYTGLEMNDAHDAMSDVMATIEVFTNQLDEHNLSFDDVDNFAENVIITPDGSLRNAAANGSNEMKLVFTMGKYKNEEFVSIYKKDRSYIVWYLENVASNYTKKLLKWYYNKYKDLY